MSIKTCLFTDRFYPTVGGAETALDSLARQLTTSGKLQVGVLAPGPADLSLPYLFFPLDKLSGNDFRQREEILSQGLTSLYDRFPFQLIHAHFAYPCGYLAVKWGLERKIPTLITCHGIDLARRKDLNFGLLLDAGIAEKCRFALKNSQAVVVLNRFMRKSALEMGAGKNNLHLIANGVDTGEYRKKLAAPLRNPYLLSVGRFSPEKGLDLLLTAFSRINKSYPDLKLVLLGWGREAPELIKQSLVFGLSNQVVFKKIKTGAEKTAFLQNCLFYVSPSRFEGSPISVLEAMAAGRAVVAFDIPGTNELVEPGRTGLLAAPEKADSLAEKIDQLLNQPGKQKEWGMEGRRLVEEKHKWSAIAGQYRNLYFQIPGPNNSGIIKCESMSLT